MSLEMGLEKDRLMLPEDVLFFSSVWAIPN